VLKGVIAEYEIVEILAAEGKGKRKRIEK